MSYLTGPVNTLADFQAEFNGLLMGRGTPYRFPPTWSFLDMAAIKTMDQARVWADGSWSGPDFADVLLPTLDIKIEGGTPAGLAAAMATLRGAFSPQAVALPLWVKIPGFAAIGIPAKTNQRRIPIVHSQMAMTQASVQFRCPDPTWQSIPRTLTLAANGAAVSGLSFPMFAPAAGAYTPPNAGADYGSTAVAGSSGVLTNAGNTPAWPVVVVSGPVTNFTINIDGNLVTWTDTVPAGQTLTIDYSTGLATLSGNIDRTYSLTSRSFSAVPAAVSGVAGLSTVFFTATTGSATVTVADVSR